MTRHLLMVYGTLKKGFSNHRCLGDAKFIAPCVVQNFDLRDLGAFPCVTHGPGQVVGELYEINDQQFQSCDRLEGYPTFYNREQVSVYTIKEQGTNTHYDGVWIYTMHNSRAPVIESGMWSRNN